MHIANLTSEIDDCEYRSNTCCYANCNAHPILSHTIARNFIYKLNTDVKKILALQPKITPIYNKPHPKLLRKIDVNKFSSFIGFCSIHDNFLFKLIDEFDGKMSKEKATLIHYRNICYGINHIKKQQLCERHMFRQSYVQGQSRNKNIDKLINMLKKGYFAKRLEYCLQQHYMRKTKLEKMIKSGDFDDIECVEFCGELNNPIFYGRSSYLLHQKNKFFSQPGYNYMPWLSYSTLLTTARNHLVFCWLKTDAEHAKFFNKFLKNDLSMEIKEIIAALAWSCSDAFAVEETIYKKHEPAIDNAIKKYRVY